MKRSAAALVAVVLTLVALIASGAFAEDPHVERPKAGAPDITTERPAESPGVAAFEKAQGYVEQVVAYVAAVQHQQQVEAYVAAVQEQQAEVEAYLAANAPPPPPPIVRSPSVQQPAPAPSTSGAVGDCTGFAVPDYIIQRESGGDPNAVNPSSGAYGCSQTLPSHYQSGGACAGLDMYSVDGQRQCTWILSDGGTNLAPWAL